jgi:acyl carrier protein
MFDQLKQILASKFQINPEQIQPDSQLSELELDSLDVVELALVMEKELGAKVSDDELFEIQRLQTIADLASTRAEAAA